MQTYTPTTPFGRRSLSHGQIMGQKAAADVDPRAVVHKWHVFNDIREAREHLGLTDRALAILNALLTFHPETTLDASGELIVFPSNNQLMARAYGISPATLRRHLSNLVDCGIVIRRDSPNGKRYARKDNDGEIAQAFGFDLMPLVARAAEFAGIAEAVRAERRALKVARETLTLLRRDVSKLIQFGLEEAVPGEWLALEERYRSIMRILPRQATRTTIEAINAELVHLRTEIEILLSSHENLQNSSASESHSERHIQNSNPDLQSESEAGSRKNQKRARSSTSNPTQEASVPVSITREMIPLRMVIDACPNIVWVGKGGDIRSWADLMAATELVRSMLGISPSAWGEAVAVLGPDHAAATLAAIYQRADLIHSAGGYLRNLVTRAKNGQFTVWPMLMALLRAKLEEGKCDGAISSV
jgi:replication initiation protein RepC